ncbi:hypothetical protein LP416_04150 [Polaromonas sp. P2-4]|nr:hypothetical protein LP416_04150 [Polaromonas sp. P2-4]
MQVVGRYTATRRFSAHPAAVAFDAAGRVSPSVCTMMFSVPAGTGPSATIAARSWASTLCAGRLARSRL